MIGVTADVLRNVAPRPAESYRERRLALSGKYAESTRLPQFNRALLAARSAVAAPLEKSPRIALSATIS